MTRQDQDAQEITLHAPAPLAEQSANFILPSGQLSLSAFQKMLRAYSPNADLLKPFAVAGDDSREKQRIKDQRSRVAQYVTWLEETGQHWSAPALAEYGSYLVSEDRSLSPASAKSHLSTLRGHFNTFLDDLLQTLTEIADKVLSTYPAADRLALVHALEADLQRALDPRRTKHIKPIKKQDRLDTEHTRLSSQQASELLAAPGIQSLRGLRDTALLALALCTGLREAELVGLDVDDLRQTSGEELGVWVSEGKGSKSRHVPYGALVWCLDFVDAWLVHANISSGAVFRGFKDRHTPEKQPGELFPAKVYPRLTKRLTTRAVQDILAAYPIRIDGSEVWVKPHDLRRTYAKLAYDSQMPILYISQNLGHASIETTQGYIGDGSATQRRAPAIFHRPHDKRTMDKLRNVSKLL